MPIPKYKELSTVIVKVLQENEGSLSVMDLEILVAKKLKLTPEEINEIHKGKKTKLQYHVLWARYYLKKEGILESAKRGVCALSKKDRQQ